jgi:hypothetical protein
VARTLKWSSLSIVWLALAVRPSIASADGGTVRCSERRASHLITVFTDPTPPRSGVIDFSVLIQDAESGTAILDLPVIVRAERIDHPDERISARVTSAAATNKLLRAAQLKLSPGRWHVELDVDRVGQGPPIGFDFDVDQALPSWMQMSPWIGWPLAAIGIFGVHRLLVRRRAWRVARVGKRRSSTETSGVYR